MARCGERRKNGVGMKMNYGDFFILEVSVWIVWILSPSENKYLLINKLIVARGKRKIVSLLLFLLSMLFRIGLLLATAAPLLSNLIGQNRLVYFYWLTLDDSWKERVVRATWVVALWYRPLLQHFLRIGGGKIKQMKFQRRIFRKWLVDDPPIFLSAVVIILCLKSCSECCTDLAWRLRLLPHLKRKADVARCLDYSLVTNAHIFRTWGRGEKVLVVWCRAFGFCVHVSLSDVRNNGFLEKLLVVNGLASQRPDRTDLSIPPSLMMVISDWFHYRFCSIATTSSPLHAFPPSFPLLKYLYMLLEE